MTLPPSGRRRRTAPVNSGQMGWIYVVCFDRPIRTAAPPAHWPRHYTGWATGLEARLAVHQAGNGSVLFRLAAEQGTGWNLVAVERGDRNRERQLKQSSASGRCIVCRARRRLEAHRITADAGDDQDGRTPEGSDGPKLEATDGVGVGAAA